MFSSEWKYILRENREAIRILLGILLIPTFYAVIFLASLWNPYQEINHLPVAVVNEDQTQNAEINYGKLTVNNLKKSKSLAFHFVDKSKAQYLLDTGKVYMIIKIPKNFTKDINGLALKKSKRVPLEYYTSAGHSFVAMKMSTTAIEKIKEELNNQILSSYLEDYSQKNSQAMTNLAALSQNRDAQSSLLHQISNTHLNPSLTNPIKLIHHDRTKVKNNGTGMAPYLISVALFVGCITLNIIYDTSTSRFHRKNCFSWWMSKMSFLYEFISIAATTMFLLLIKVNGLQPIKPFQTFLFVLLTSVTFLSIVTFFNIILGMTGAWLMLLFMIIQLGGSAGTYPIQLSNNFFQAIHPYLPMSISIDAFRSTISIGNSIIPELTSFITLFIFFNTLMLIFFQKTNKSASH